MELGTMMAIGGGLMGLMGGSNPGQSTQSQKVTLDPRMDAAVYGSGGIVPTMSDWYSKNNNGMNDQMLQGLNQQYQTLNDPFTQAGYNRTAMNGYNLMGGGVAGNPFTSGAASLGGGFNPSAGAYGGLAPQAMNGAGFGALSAGSGPFKMPSLFTPPAPQAAAPYVGGLLGRTGGMGAGAYGSSGGYAGTLPFDTGPIAEMLGNLGFTGLSDYIASQNDGYSALSGNAGYADPRDAAAYGYGTGNTAPTGLTSVGQLAQQYGMYNNPNASGYSSRNSDGEGGSYGGNYGYGGNGSTGDRD